MGVTTNNRRRSWLRSTGVTEVVIPRAAAVPEVGQIVTVRGANWAVVDVQQQGLGRSSADDASAQLQHAVTLQSVQENRLGHELRVVWELEQGRSALAHRGLPEEIDPDKFDDPNRLAAFIDALRWGAITSADDGTVQAPFRSGANVEPYQLTPLKRALASPRANLLLADDVGLGKTIEGGLVIQELLLRHRARTVIVVCPAGLAFKWQDEMQEKFGLDFTVVNSETMKDVRRSHGVHANPFTLFPRIIVSMAWLPGQRAQRQLRDAFANPPAGGLRSTSSSSTRPITSRRAVPFAETRSGKSAAVTPSTRNAPAQCGTSQSAPSTVCSSVRHRTTATRSPSRRSWR